MSTAGLTNPDSREADVVADDLSANPETYNERKEMLWRSLKYFSYYRLTVAGMFLVTVVAPGGIGLIGSKLSSQILTVCIIYVVLASLYLMLVSRWRWGFNLQLGVQVLTDILLLSLLQFFSKDTSGGFSLMLMVVVAGAGLVGQSRFVFAYSLLAALAVFVEKSVHGAASLSDFSTPALTSIAFLAIALVARRLAQRALLSEELARWRGIELADQMQISQRVIRDMQDGVLVVDIGGNVRQSNPKAMRLLGFKGDALPEKLVDCSPLLAHEFALRQMSECETEVLLQQQGGDDIRVIFQPPGEGGASLIFLEDIGRHRQRERQAKLAALGRLTANIAHEVRNPLSSITHAADLLADGPHSDENQKLLRIISANAKRINHMVAEVEELGDRDRVEMEVIDVNTFVEQMLEERSLVDMVAATPLHLDLPSNSMVVFDRGHFYRVLTNLINNALHYASGKPHSVRVFGQFDTAPSRFTLHVVDDGKGVAESERDQLFEPFFTTRPGGSGLGLYIAAELCEANGARLQWLENSPGAHFCISCPLPDVKHMERTPT